MAGILEEKNIYSGFKKFISFIKKEDVINLGIGFILATAINNFLLIVIDSIIMPIVNRIFGPEASANIIDTTDASNASNNNVIKFKNRTFNIFGINFGIGQFVIGLVQFIIILYIVYLISLMSM